MGRGVAVVALALVTGGVVGYLMGAGREQAPAHAGRAAPAASPDSPAAFRSEPSSDLGRALKDLPAVEPPRGNGTITGSVHDEAGNPVGGVLIQAVPRSEPGAAPARALRPPDPPDLEEEVRSFVAGFHRQRLGRAEAKSGRDGTYVLTELTDAPYRVRAYLADHVVDPVNNADAVRPDSQVDFVAHPAIEVRVDVLLPDGSRPSEAVIGLGEEKTRPWEASEPVLFLAPGAYTFSAELRGDDSYRSQEVARELLPGKPVEPVVLRLEGRSGIRGRVSLAPGDRFPYVAVRALRYGADRPPTKEELADSDTSFWMSGRGNRYRFLDLPPGRYLVGVDIGQETIVATRSVDVAGAIVVCDFDVGPVEPRNYVIVRVYAPGGEPLSDVRLESGARSAGGASWGSTDFVRRPDASLLLVHKSRYRDDPAAVFFVTAISAKYGAKQASYKIADRNEIEIRFDEAATVEISLRGYNDARLAGALEVKLSSAAARDAVHLPSTEAVPDADGRATLGPVAAGPCEILVEAKTDKWNTTEIARESVELRPGRNAIALSLPSLHDLTVIAEPGTELNLSKLERFERWIVGNTAGADGRVVFPRLTAGRYELKVSGAQEGVMGVVVPAPGEVAWRPQPCNAFIVLLGRPDSAGLGLEEGDLVVAVDGAAIESQGQGRTLLAAAAGKAEVSLTVCRGARTFPVKVSGKALGAALDAAGGALHPTAR